MLVAKKQFSGDIVQDIIETRERDLRELNQKKINYKIPKSDILLDFLDWNTEFVVFADCDTDGLAGAAICNIYFDQYAQDNIIHYEVASRSQRGFQQQDVKNIRSKYPNATGILTVDCGILSFDAVEYAKEYGIDILITDHHNPNTELPDTNIFNPKLDNTYTDFKEFCGAGLIYLLLKQCFGEDINALQYAAIATIADMVPLLSDNRVLVKQGMNYIRNPKTKYHAIDNFFSGIGAFVTNEKDIAWGIVPVINSASRLGHEEFAYKGFVQNDEKAIKALVELNNQRKQIVTETYENNKKDTQVSVNGVSIYIGTWDNPGLLGLIAMVLLTDYNLPAIAWCDNDNGISNFSLRAPKSTEFIEHLKSFVIGISGGGHDEAAGFSYTGRPELIIKEFHAYYDDLFNNDTVSSGDNPSTYDIEIDIIDAINTLPKKDTLRPFGQEFEEPIYVSRCVEIKDSGTTKSKQYKKYNAHGAIIIDFKNIIPHEGTYDIAYKISNNYLLKGPQLDVIGIEKVET